MEFTELSSFTYSAADNSFYRGVTPLAIRYANQPLHIFNAKLAGGYSGYPDLSIST